MLKKSGVYGKMEVYDIINNIISQEIGNVNIILPSICEIFMKEGLLDVLSGNGGR